MSLLMRDGHRIHSAGTMAQDTDRGTAARRELPRIVTIAGLKKSGKTTVAAALIRELCARGQRVGSVKTIHHHPLSLDTSGADTRRHAEAGAEFTVALLDGELAYFEPRASRPGLVEAARLFTPGVDWVVWEGMSDPGAGGAHVVCLREMADLDKTLAERRVDRRWIIAISGVAAGLADTDGAPEGVKVLDATRAAGAAELADLVVRWFGEARP
jgi:molybdopterin-guanine dinucleotide biosynthesis adapter protein